MNPEDYERLKEIHPEIRDEVREIVDQYDPDSHEDLPASFWETKLAKHYLDVTPEDEESHHVETYRSRHFGDTVEVWCPNVDETKAILGTENIRNCLMCGEEIDV